MPPKTISELKEAYRSNSATPTEVTKAALARIGALNPRFNCFITVLPESAMEAAKASSRRMEEGKPIGPLDGVPVAVKDIVYIEGVRCTAGSNILSDNVAKYDAPAVRRLKAAGAVIVGTTNLHEFACGVTSENPHYGSVRNPWDPTRVSGGSSGGSAAATSLGMVAGALGTDTAGSVRIPASLCGVVGLKPTYGRVSRLGVIPLAPTFDTVGTLTASCTDAAIMLQAIAGGEQQDVTTSATAVPDYLSAVREKGGRVRLGVAKGYLREGVSPGVGRALDSFVGRLSELGWDLAEVDMPETEEASRLFPPIRRAEATAFHLRWLDAVPELYGADVKELLELGRAVKAVDYVNAVNARPGLMERALATMDGLDAVLSPCTPITAPPLGTRDVEVGGSTRPVYSTLNRLTLPLNVLGFPALSLPMGLVGGLPAGAQLFARPFEEGTLLRLGAEIERSLQGEAGPPAVAS